MSMKVQLARAIASQLGYDYDRVFEHKQEWIAEGGMRGGRFHDVNEPYRTDFDSAADAVLDALMEPTTEMEVDGALHFREHPGDANGCYQAMIQAAKEGK